jgi:PST family polysaccharide transporter
LAISGLLTGVMILLAEPAAVAFGEESAAPVIAVLAVTIFLSGVGVVPYARLQRQFEQRKLFAVDAVSFVITTGLSLGLVLSGVGPMALAASRVVAQAVATILQFRLARVRPRLGFDRSIMRGAVRFGLPLALANMLSWALLNADNIIVSRTSGAVALGFYVLAFNVSSWPMTAIGQGIRPVTFAAFARLQNDDPEPSILRAVGLASAAGVPIAVLLAVLALPLVTLLYGARWAPSAAALAGLAGFGGLRVVLDVLATYLMARGRAGMLLGIQVCWFLLLVPAMIAGTAWAGLAGAGWAHLVVAALFVLPLYLVAVRRTGARAGAVLRGLWRPLVAVVPAGVAAYVLAKQVESPAGAVLVGGCAGMLFYGTLLYGWIRSLISPPAPAGDKSAKTSPTGANS